MSMFPTIPAAQQGLKWLSWFVPFSIYQPIYIELLLFMADILLWDMSLH